MQLLYHIGRYFILLRQVLRRPEKASIYRKQIFLEINNIGLDSLGIVIIISIFMGAVVAIQTAYNIDSPLVPRYTVGFTTRQSLVLEFSPTIISLILAGKVGSRIASEIGTMRVTEQIDALEIMGINPAGYLILPKIVAAMLINPIIITISMFVGLFGGWIACAGGQSVTPDTYVFGIQSYFKAFEVFYALIKTVVFAFIITSVAGYQGYYTEGGALEVGKASTKAVVHASILIILFNLILTQLLLS
ncbi:MAG: ABC transporter permease [Bacteroidetes bacterium CG2_30_32_10]|nr:MAG: ABC transporter permease [Bacteroidetes bacterium CG2_30_32_10]